MKRIMILGIGPIAGEFTQKFHGGGNRAWHFAKPLLDKGFEVILVCMRITDKQASSTPYEQRHDQDALTYYSVDEIQCFANDEYLRNLIEEHQPDAIIGACDYPASRAVAIAGDLPIWADVHGYPMGEAQAKAHHYNDQGYIHHFWNIHHTVLRRADRFSVTSERQRMALIGELGAMGRLNGYTFCEPLVTQIPIAWNPETPYHFNQRNKDEDLILFFCGGYNLWCDVDTLFQGVEKAMHQDSRIRFLSTGGAIDGHDEKTYPRFKEQIEASPLRDRFDLRGWVSNNDLHKCMKQVHLGINVDFPCYETLIGARNRITELMARGIPILTTLGTEISQILFYKNMALSVPMQNPIALANEIILAANHPEKMETFAKEARKLFDEQYTYHLTTGDLLEWCTNPHHSGDFNKPPVILYYQHPDQQKTSSPSLIQKMKGWLHKQSDS